MKRLLCSAIAAAVLAGCQTTKAADYYTYTNVHVFTIGPGDGMGWPAWRCFSQINTNFGWASNLIYVSSNAVWQIQMTTSNALRQAGIASTNDLAAAFTADLNSASNHLQGEIDGLDDGSGKVDNYEGIATNLSLKGVIFCLSLTPSTAVYINSQNMLVSSATTATELGRLSGVTGFVQDQLNAGVAYTLAVSNTLKDLINGKEYAPGTQPPNYIWASPDGAYGSMVPRAMVNADLPAGAAAWGNLPTYSKSDSSSGASTNLSLWNAIFCKSLTPSTAVYINSQNMLVSSATTATELGRLSGVTSSVQEQLNTLDSDLDLKVGTSSGLATNLTARGTGGNATALAIEQGNLTVSGTATAAAFSGSGTNLTGLPVAIADSGITIVTNTVNGQKSYTFSASAASGSLLQSGTVNMATDGTVTTIYTITGIPNGCAFSVYGLVSAYGTSGGTTYSACADAVAHGVKTAAGQITVNYGTALSGFSTSFSSGGYDDDGSGNLKISVGWNAGIGTAHAKWSGFVNVVQ